MIEEGLEVPELPNFNVELECDSDSSSTATDRKYFVCVFNISLWGGGGVAIFFKGTVKFPFNFSEKDAFINLKKTYFNGGGIFFKGTVKFFFL